jgi:hypothetical protein
MIEGIKTIHVALQYNDRKQAEIFFNKILKLPFIKTFNVSKELANNIFKINEEVTVDVYGNKDACFEVFFTNKQTKYRFEHTCIKINDKKEFLKRCNEYDIKPIIFKKDVKTLLFIKDFSGNLFEIKEKQ